jgi:acetyltransferase
MPTQKDLKPLFNPKSIAVVGASQEPQKLGAIVLKNIIESGFKGKLFPINPNYESLADLKCYKSLSDLTELPDLAILAVPASVVAQILKECEQKGIKNVLVFAAGYKETGAEGEKLEKELIETADRAGLNLLGPNCLGYVNNLTPINATFGQPPKNSGNLRFVTQSGAIATSLFDWCDQNEIGINEFVTLGNKAILNENDVLAYFLSDTELNTNNRTGLSSLNPIGLYLESIASGPQFLKIAKKISRTDPIFLLKPGKTPSAQKAMSSHTGAIAQEDDILQALVDQAGITRCQTLQEFFDFAKAFSWENLPAGPKIAIVSNAGGPAVVSADAVSLAGLELAQLDDNTKNKLAEILPRAASLINPVDVLGDALADRYAEAMEILLQKPEVDSLLVLLTPQIMTQIEKTAVVIGEASKKFNKPIFCSFMGGTSVSYGEGILNRYKIPSFRFPEEAISAISAMYRYKIARDRLNQKIHGTATTETQSAQYAEAKKIVQHALGSKNIALDNLEADAVISSAGISTPPTESPKFLQEALDFANKNGYPVVLKLSSPKLLHKREVGGIILNIGNAQSLTESWEQLQKKSSELPEVLRTGMGFQIQKDVSGGVELIVGIKQDATFGSVLLFGAGGMFAELIADKNLHLLPVNLEEAKRLVEKSKVYKVLKGKTEEPPYALAKLYQLIVAMGQLANALPEVREMEINPVIIDLNNVWAIDVKVVLTESKEPETAASKFKLAGCVGHALLASKFNQYDFESSASLSLKPGQYINVKVAPNTIRAYSVGTTTDDRHFSLLVDTRPGGPGSQFFENLKIGDVVTYMGPFGAFTFRLDDGAEALLFLATGSGMSAIRCLIESVLIGHKITKPVNLYFGLTHEGEIFWQEQLNDLQKRFPNFTYQICLCKPDDSWKGPTGFITKLVEQDYPNANKCSAYLCGHKNMIADATDLLLKLGCPKERIYSERFA